MAKEARQDSSTCPLILSGYSFVKNGKIKSDGGRTTPLLNGTVMGYDTGSGEWVPYNDIDTQTGASVPQGIYIGDDILAADIVSGDVEDCSILVGGCCTVDDSLVVFDDGTLDADSVVAAAAANPYFVISARACLAMFGIFMADSVGISGFEN